MSELKIGGYLEVLDLRRENMVLRIGENARVGTIFVYESAKYATIILNAGAVVGSIATESDIKITGTGEIAGIAVKKSKKIYADSTIRINFQVYNECPIIKEEAAEKEENPGEHKKVKGVMAESISKKKGVFKF